MTIPLLCILVQLNKVHFDYLYCDKWCIGLDSVLLNVLINLVLLLFQSYFFGLYRDIQ